MGERHSVLLQVIKKRLAECPRRLVMNEMMRQEPDRLSRVCRSIDTTPNAVAQFPEEEVWIDEALSAAPRNWVYVGIDLQQARRRVSNRAIPVGG
jgi:hypothetical protein